MTKVTFYKNSDTDLYFGFDIKGHSGYAESGSDIVCSAISSMTMLFLNVAEDVISVPFEFESNEDTAEISFNLGENIEIEKLVSISKAINSFKNCLKTVQADYSKFVKVSEKNVRI